MAMIYLWLGIPGLLPVLYSSVFSMAAMASSSARGSATAASHGDSSASERNWTMQVVARAIACRHKRAPGYTLELPQGGPEGIAAHRVATSAHPLLLVLRGGGTGQAPTADKDSRSTRGRSTIAKGWSAESVSEWNSVIALVYFALIPYWMFFAVFGGAIMVMGAESFSKQGANFYLRTSAWCFLLTLPALVTSIAGLAYGYDARWLKVLPACVFGVSIMAFYADMSSSSSVVSRILDCAPPELAVASVVAGMCATMFLGRRGAIASGTLVCCALLVLICSA
eukprot:g10387.t1